MSGSSRVSEEEFELESDSGRLTDSTTYASHNVSFKNLIAYIKQIYDISEKKLVYRQLGDSNSQWHKKTQKVPVGGSFSWGKCRLGNKNLTLGHTIFSNFEVGKN